MIKLRKKRRFVWQTDKCNNWVNNIKLLFLECNLENAYSNHEICITERVSGILIENYRNIWNKIPFSL